MEVLKALILLGAAVSTLADKSAPVLVWEPAVSSAPALPALPAMSNAQLQSHLNSLDSKALVIFIMNELNVEDFSGYPSAFSHLQEEFESSQNAFTPSMTDPSQLPEHLDAYSRVTVDPDNLASMKLAPDTQKTLFLVYVGDRASAERQAALGRADALISKVLTKVKSLTGKYSAVLTGKHTTMGGEAQRRTARSLKAAAEGDMSQFENLGCVFIYTSSPAVLRFAVTDGKDTSGVWRLDLGQANITADCQNSSDTLQSQSVTLSWKDKTSDYGSHSLNLASITLTLNFQARLTGSKEPADDRVSSWTLAPVTLAYSGTLDANSLDGSQTLDFGNVYAPNEFSYHCTNRSWTTSTKPNATEGVIAFSALELPGFQVQAFVPEGAAETFGRAWDCTTFFTIPIWSGLFLSLILLLVLVWSLMMLASVPTMDRFDDPRGQPLHVPNAE